MNCAICKSVEFDAAHPVGEDKVYLNCTNCGFPTYVVGENAALLVSAMKGLEDFNQNDTVRGELLKMYKEYRSGGMHEYDNSAAITEIYQLLHHEDVVTIEWLRCRYRDRMAYSIKDCIKEQSDRDFMQCRKDMALEVMRRLARVLDE